MSQLEDFNLDTDDYNDEALFDLGRELFEDRYHEAAIVVGEQLLSRSYSGGFELKALGLAAMRDYATAVEVLTKGVEVAPKVWRLWDLLGLYQGELDALEEARASFRQALELPSADTSSISLHWATVETNFGNFAEAHALAEQVTDLEDELDRQLLRLRIHWSEGKLEEAYAIGKELLMRDEGENPSWRALAAATLGQVCLQLGKREEALALAREASRLDDADDTVLWLVREMGGRIARGTPTMYHLMLVGTEERDGEELSFFQRYDVTANSEEEALALVQEYLELSGNEALTVDSIEAGYQWEETMAGVYRVNARCYFVEDDE